MVFGFQGGSLGSAFRRSARGYTSTAAALFGIRVSRATTLRVSALLIARTLVSLIALPFAPDIVSGAFAAAFAAAQSAAVFAAFADRFSLTTVFGSWGEYFFSSADAPFVSIYGSAVIVLAPLATLLETAAVVFDTVRLTRRFEDRMASLDAAAAPRWEALTVALSACAFAGTTGAVYALDVPEVHAALGVVFVLLFTTVFFYTAGNIMHVVSLFAYAAYLLVAASSENADVSGAPSLLSLHSPTARATLLVLSSVMALVGITRAPVVVQTVLDSADVFAAGADLRSGFEKCVLSCLAIVALTFRFLVFHADLLQGEYYPLACRGVQVVALLVGYVLIMHIEESDVESAAAVVEK